MAWRRDVGVATMADALIGTWLRRSHRVADSATGETTEPFGSAPRGVLMVAADGRMSVVITPGTEPAAAAPLLIAYSGHWRVPAPGRFVTTVDVASIPSWVGTAQTRGYVVVGDRLELSTAPARMLDAADSSETRIGTMVWNRETTAVASGGASD